MQEKKLYYLLLFSWHFIPLLNPLGIFSDLRTTSFDTFQIFPREGLKDDPIIIIDIDDESLNKIGQWPWSRDTLAKLTDPNSN